MTSTQTVTKKHLLNEAFTRWLFFCLFITISFTGFPQTEKSKDTSHVNSLLSKSKEQFGEDPEQAIDIAQQALDISLRFNFKTGQATALKNIGIGHYLQQKYVEALDYFHQSLSIFEKLRDDVGTSNLLNNIGGIYNEQGDHARALDYCLKALKLAEKTNDKMRMLSSYANIGSIYHNRNKKDPKVIEYLMKALPLSEALGNKETTAVLLGNIGEVYFDQNNDEKAISFYRQSIATGSNTANSAFIYNGIGKVFLRQKQYDLALNNHRKALDIAEKVNDKMKQLGALQGIANVHFKQKDYQASLAYFAKAEAIGTEINASNELKDLYQELSKVYVEMDDYKNAYEYKVKYGSIRDTIFNLESAKKLGRIQFDFDLYKKEGEIKLLTNEQKLNALELQKQRQSILMFTIGIVLLLIFAFVISREYRNKAKLNKKLDKQKAEIQNLISNILPAEVAKELQETGRSMPKSFQTVSVMFSDFKNFTSLAERISPEQLIQELNICFVAFDTIIEKYKLEKIKTIGDAYMCAGGIPTEDLSHPFRMVKAAMEIQAYMRNFNQARVEAGFEPLQMRIGIHVGPVVAGVVGKKKFAYDIWGSTVNIASRMESNGEPDKVNISRAVYELVKEKYICTHRGKIYAKNIGEIDMFFVQSEIMLPEDSSRRLESRETLNDIAYAE